MKVVEPKILTGGQKTKTKNLEKFKVDGDKFGSQFSVRAVQLQLVEKADDVVLSSLGNMGAVQKHLHLVW